MDVATRATYRGQVTKVANSASEYLKLPETQIKECNADKFYEIEEELTVYLERLTVAHQSLTRATSVVRDTLTPEDKQKDCESIAEYEDKAVTVIARLRKRIAKLQEVQSRSLNVSSSDPHRSICNHNSAAKLPKLSLRTFSGDFKEWLPFWEAFRTAVHDQDNLTGADKFNYLQLHLTGKAADSISGFIPSDENYHAAISLLQEEYGDTEKLIDHTIQQLMSLSQVSSRRDALGLRRLYNSVTTSTRSLTVLGVPSTQYSVMLKSLLLRCIPDELVVDFYRTHQGTSSDDNVENVAADITSLAGSETSSIGYNGDKQVRDILKYLKGEVESLERSIQTQTNRPLVQRSQREYKTAAGLLTSNEVLKCCFCNSDSHTSQHCNTPLTIAQRKEILKREGRCFRCTRRGHNSRACMSKSIKCDHCGGRHSLSMCDPSYHSSLTEPPSSRSTNTKSINTAEVLPTTSLCSATSESSDVYLQTACVLASHSNALNSQSTSIRIILDGGSQRTYITQHVASKLGLQIFDKVKLRILPFGCVEKSPVKLFNRVQVVLKGRHNKQPVSLLAVVVPSICVDILPVPSAKCPMFTKFELADDEIYSESGLCMLIGADYYWNIVYNESKRITSNLVAINSIFGWTIQGPVVNSVNKESLILSAATTTLNVCTVDDTDLKRFWDLESVGIMNNNINNEAWDFNNYVVKNGERYEASLLWRQDNILLDDNRNCAVFRCKKLIQKLARDESKLMEYDAAMQEMIEFGVAERVNEDCIAERIFYMPHRPVYREDKATTKLRIVFDASAHSGTNLSLNQNLSAGPNLLPDLLTVLLNFRIGANGLVADIEKAFLQISLAARDRDAHRFLWFEDKVTCKGQLPPLAVYRMTRVTFGVACSPFLLCATLKKHFTQESQVFPETCDLLQNSFYMDDFVTSIDDMKTAINVHKESCEILGRASMRIRKWNSNCQQMRTSFNEKPPKIQKVLGLIWSCYNDELAIDLRQLCDVKILAPTKRNVLEVIAKIFDPLGLFGPFVVKLKILFQELWKLKLDWDESTPRLFWKLAVVANVFPGRDGKIRACELRFSNGSILRRPIQHIYPLELKSQLNRPAGGC